MRGIEPPASRATTWRSTTELHPPYCRFGRAYFATRTWGCQDHDRDHRVHDRRRRQLTRLDGWPILPCQSAVSDSKFAQKGRHRWRRFRFARTKRWNKHFAASKSSSSSPVFSKKLARTSITRSRVIGAGRPRRQSAANCARSGKRRPGAVSLFSCPDARQESHDETEPEPSGDVGATGER